MTKDTDHHDEWYSKVDWYIDLCQKYGIFPLLDVAATDEYHMCDRYFTIKDDALTKKWDEDFWMNPPLLAGNTKKFTLYAFHQARDNKVDGLCVIPAGVISRKWFRPLWEIFVDSPNEVFIDPIPRPSFLDRGKETAQSRNDYIVLCFRFK